MHDNILYRNRMKLLENSAAEVKHIKGDKVSGNYFLMSDKIADNFNNQ